MPDAAISFHLSTQGVDFELVRSTRPALLRKRVANIELEVRASDCEPLYEGQAGCDDVVQCTRAASSPRERVSVPPLYLAWRLCVHARCGPHS